MSVSIGARTNYSLLLDEKLEHDALTGMLDMDNAYVGEVNSAGQVNIPQFSVMDGLFDYSTANGYTDGDLTLNYQQVTLEYDRGVSFGIDRKADEQAAMVASATLMDEFFRAKLVPEVDLARFSAYATAADGASHAAYATLTSSTIVEAIDAGQASIGQVCDPTEAVLFISWDCYSLLKQAAPYRFTEGSNGYIDRNIEYFDGIKVVRVPKARFYASVIKDTTNGGLIGSNEINFLFVVPRAVQQVKKFEILKVFTPDENQSKDAWLFQIRLHHGMWLLSQKADGVYVHTKSTIDAMSVDPATLTIKASKSADVAISKANGIVTAAITGTEKDNLTATVAADYSKVTIAANSSVTATNTATVTLTDSIGDTATIAVTIGS